ncbi:MAG: nickel-dependent hydrogenase large subunit [Candidatus Omnitrophota bacterium]
MSKMAIPVGPQHPALKEPASFMLYLEGERIAAANVTLGYNHRGIEKACENRTYIQSLYLIERICGICSHSHATCFAQTTEEVAGIEIPKKAAYARTLIGELERVHSHLLWLGVAGHEIGFDTLFMYSWRDRELVMELLATLTGNRVNYGINTFGGVRRDFTPEQLQETLKVTDILEERTKYYISVVLEENTILARLAGVGKLSKEDAIRFGATGPTARAAGVDKDVRRDDPYAAYSDVKFDVIIDDHADVLGRAIVRVKELMETYKIIRQLIQTWPSEGPINVKFPKKVPANEAITRYEAPRGEDVHYVKGNGTDKAERVKVRAPTLANLTAISHMLEGGYLADVPIVIAAIDPCFSCTDRMISIIDTRNDHESLWDWYRLRKYSIDWYKKNGIDFNDKKILR